MKRKGQCLKCPNNRKENPLQFKNDYSIHCNECIPKKKERVKKKRKKLQKCIKCPNNSKKRPHLFCNDQGFKLCNECYSKEKERRIKEGICLGKYFKCEDKIKENTLYFNYAKLGHCNECNLRKIQEND
eukprot:TRINITY_DN17672_c0_g1_i1.p1 TRINITY_DN17672_c0_g1~~TRINITY_DN17672_c0_g1_i1.p1  ORF type:complete len:129 (+),score=32.91 TRINITY_DN17672_c0_g1_i1:248-634(+)